MRTPREVRAGDADQDVAAGHVLRHASTPPRRSAPRRARVRAPPPRSSGRERALRARQQEAPRARRGTVAPSKPPFELTGTSPRRLSQPAAPGDKGELSRRARRCRCAPAAATIASIRSERDPRLRDVAVAPAFAPGTTSARESSRSARARSSSTARADLPRRLEPVHHRHRDVHQHDVRRERGGVMRRLPFRLRRGPRPARGRRPGIASSLFGEERAARRRIGARMQTE